MRSLIALTNSDVVRTDFASSRILALSMGESRLDRLETGPLKRSRTVRTSGPDVWLPKPTTCHLTNNCRGGYE